MVAPILQQAILKALNDIGPMTSHELALHTGRAHSTVRYSLMPLHKRRQIFVHSWQRPVQQGKKSRVWAIGPGADVPQPPRDSQAVRDRRSYAKNKALYKQREAAKRGELTIWSGLIAPRTEHGTSQTHSDTEKSRRKSRTRADRVSKQAAAPRDGVVSRS